MSTKGKEATVNTITTEIQQITIRSKAKSIEWVEQDEIHEATKAWVEKANAANVNHMPRESVNATSSSHVQDMTPVEDPIWQALADC